MKDEIVDVLHQPEYTGENRCEACTVVNVIIAAVLSAIVARKSKLAAVVTAGISAALIYLRGYLVPGTPTLTKRYLPPSVLRLFGKDPEPTTYSGFGAVDPEYDRSAQDTSSAADPTVTGTDQSATGSTTTESDDSRSDETAPDETASEPTEDEAIDPETHLLETGVVEPCDDVDDLCLSTDFEAEWNDEIEATDVDALDASDAAAAIGLDEDESELEIETHDEARVLRRDGQVIGQWPSQAALVADVTAAHVLESWDDDWESLSIQQKGSLLQGLRLFLETCPTTGGEITMGEETVESCCQSYDVVAVTCDDSGERLFEHPVETLEA